MKNLLDPLKLSLAALVLGTAISEAQITNTWNGGGGDANWSTTGNWSPGTPSAGDSLIFSGSTQTSPNNNFATDTGFGGIQFSPTASAFTLGGNEIAFAGLVENAAPSTIQTITLPLLLTNATTFNTISNLDTTTDDLLVSGGISGTGSLTKIGGGTLTLSSASHSGGTTISAGLLVINNNIGNITLAGGSLKMNFRTYFINPTYTFTADAAVGIDLLDNTEPRGIDFYGNIGSLGYKFTKTGEGIFRLGGGGVTASSINVAEGTLANLGGSALALTRWGVTNVITVQNGATLRADDGSVVPNPIVLMGGDGTASGSYTHQGAIVSGSRNNGGNPTNNIFTNTITLLGDSTVGSQYGNMIVSGNITGPGALTKIGANPLVLSGVNDFGGATTINVGTLQVGSATAIPSGATNGAVQINGASKLDLNGNAVTVVGLADDAATTAFIDNSSTTPASLTIKGSATFVGAVQNTGGGALSIVMNGAAATASFLGINTYSGSNVVKQGKLDINIPTGTTTGGAVSVADATELSLHFRVPGSSLLAAGATFGTSGATILDVDIGNFGNPTKPVINATNGAGILSANGTLTVNVTGNGTVMSVGQFPIVKYTTRTGTGNFVVGNLPASVTAIIVTNTPNKSIDLKVLSAPVTTWVGNNGSAWDINTTVNWKTLGVPGKYVDGIAVLFDDSSAVTNVNLTTTLSPTAVTVSSTNTYTFGGAGALVAGDLSKSGSGTLIVQTVNSYNNTVIGGGTLQLADGAAGVGTLGVGTVDDEAILSVNSTNAVTLTSQIFGAGTVVKQNTNTLVLNAANTYSGSTTISQGLIQLGNAAGLGTPATGVPLATIASGASLDVNGKMVSVTNPIVISGAGISAIQGAVFNTAGQGCDIGCTKFGVQSLTLAGDASIGNNGGSFSIGNSLNNSALGNLNGNGFSLTKVGNNTLIMSTVARTAPSQFVIVGGGALFTAGNPIGGVIVISNNAWMDTFDNINNAGFTITNNFIIGTGGGQLRNTRGAFFGVADVNVYPGSITLNDNLTILNTSSWSGGPANVLTLGKMTFTGPMAGTGGVFNNGAVNTVTLNGVNTYTGATAANAGVLQLSASQQGGGTYTNTDAGSLDIPSQTGNVTLPMASFTAGTTNGGTVYLTRLTAVSTTLAPITATNLTVIGTNALILPGLAYATAGQYPIIKYTGSVNGGGVFVAGGAVRGVPGYISNNVANSSIDLVVPGGTPVIWTGSANNGWDIFSSVNWQTNGIGTDYEQTGATGDAVTFNDSSSINNVNITTPVSPALMVVSNATKVYGIGGAAINGTTSLIKNGPGTLIVSNANSFTGGTLIAGGTLKMATNNALNNASGSGVTVTGNGVLDFNSTNSAASPNGLACTISGAGFNGLGTLVNNITNSLGGTAMGPGSVTLAGSATIGGTNRWDIRGGANTLNSPSNSYTLTKVGSGIIGLSGTTVSPNLGDINILAGTLAYEGATTRLGNPANNIYIANGATLRFNSASVPLNKPIICSNNSAIGANGGNSTTVNIINSLVKLDSGTVNLNLNFYNGITFSNEITGAGGISLQFQSIVTLAASNSFTGAVTVPRCNGSSGGLGTRLFLTGSGSITKASSITLQGLQSGQAFAAFLDVLGRPDKTLTLGTNQTLRGDNGAFIRGSVVAPAGSLISIGGSSTNYQFMSISNNLTLQAGSTNVMDIYKTATLKTNDIMNVSNLVTYAGTLQIQTNGNAALVVGDAFKLFYAGSAAGNFNNIADASGTTWSFNPVTGTATVTGLPPTVNTNSTNITVSVTGNLLTMQWPADHTGWLLQSNSVGLINTGAWFNVTGSDTTNKVNVTINPSQTNVFYRMKY